MDERVASILRNATPLQIRWVIARLSTNSDSAAARRVGVHPDTVFRWSNKSDLDEAVNRLLQDAVEEAVGVAALILSRAAPEAAQALVDELSGGNKVRAAEAILDRVGLGRQQTLQAEGGVVVSFVWDDGNSDNTPPAPSQ